MKREKKMGKTEQMSHVLFLLSFQCSVGLLSSWIIAFFVFFNGSGNMLLTEDAVYPPTSPEFRGLQSTFHCDFAQLLAGLAGL